MRYLAINVWAFSLAWLGIAWMPAAAAPSSDADLLLDPSDRILVMAPHPDDEVLACGGIIQKAVAMKLPVRVVFLTYGDNNELSFLVYRKHPVLFPGDVKAMGQVRHDEALRADTALGLSTNDLVFLGYPDFGTMRIWNEHWDTEPPLRGMLTRVTAVCYPSAYRPGAPFKGEEVLKDITSVLRDFKPTKIFLSHPGDHNPDHRALYLFTRVALWDLEKEMKPDLFPYLLHYKNWPHPRRYAPDMKLGPPPSLESGPFWRNSPLSTAEVERKKSALERHVSQMEYSSHYLLSFVRQNELFGDFPALSLAAIRPPDSYTLDHVDASQAHADENLTDEERAAFVGLEKRYINREGDDMALTIQFDRPLAQMVESSVYVFGYRAGVAFGGMPKIHLKIGAVNYECFNRTIQIPSETVSLTRKAREVVIRIPLKTLGNPDRILTSARTYMGDIPLDWVSWRILDAN